MLQPHLFQVDLQLLGDQHRDRGVGALAHFDIGHGQDDLPIVCDADEGIGREAIGFGRFALPLANGRRRLSIRPPPAAAPARRKALPLSTASARPRSRRSRRSARRRRAPRSRRPGLTARSCNAATASRARSCPLRRCWRATRIRRMPISTMRCPAISAAVGPTSVFARRSKRPRNRADRGADDDPRSPHPAQRYARRGSRCAKQARSPEPCSCRRQRSDGMSIRRRAERKAAKCFTRRRGDASNMASLPPTPPAYRFPKA